MAIVNINIGEVDVSENDNIITTTNIGEVNEGFESETVLPKPVRIKNIDGNEGKHAFFVLYIKWD